jgi:hypothetical protein
MRKNPQVVLLDFTVEIIRIFDVAKEMFMDMIQAFMDNSTIATLRREADRLRMMAEKIDRLVEDLRALENGQTPPQSKEPAVEIHLETKADGRFTKMTQIEAVETILKERGKATVGSIFDELNAGGKSLLKPMYVSTLLSKSKSKFQSLGGGVWTLVQPEFLPHESNAQGSVTP